MAIPACEYDVIVVGGGPAGLSAALVLGRSCRRVLLCDAGNPRNSSSDAMHGFLSRDGTPPAEFLRLGRAELACYSVAVCEDTVTDVVVENTFFRVQLQHGEEHTTRKVLLATGVVDRVPEIEGLQQFYGKSVHHCPYCDGWEYRGGAIAVYGKGPGGLALSLLMKAWSPDVILCTDGPARLLAEDREKLLRNEIQVREEKIARLEGINRQLERIVFQNGDVLSRHALFFSTGNLQRSELPAQLGCARTEKGAIRMNKKQGTNVRGVYVAGDACYDSQYVVIAAAEGAKAAMGLHAELHEEELQ